jgi:hypothetical protein
MPRGGPRAGSPGSPGDAVRAGSRPIARGRRVSKPTLRELSETSATSVHVVTVSMEGADPLVWRRLELPSAMTLDRVHEVLQKVFAWEDMHLHAFETAYGEFGPPGEPHPWLPGPGDEAAVAFAQVAGEEGAEIAYVYDFGDDWRHAIVVEKIISATPGVSYPRCTAGWGETPEEDSGGIWMFNAQRARMRRIVRPYPTGVDDVDHETETYMLKHLATVLVPES